MGDSWRYGGLVGRRGTCGKGGKGFEKTAWVFEATRKRRRSKREGQFAFDSHPLPFLAFLPIQYGHSSFPSLAQPGRPPRNPRSPPPRHPSNSQSNLRPSDLFPPSRARTPSPLPNHRSQKYQNQPDTPHALDETLLQRRTLDEGRRERKPRGGAQAGGGQQGRRTNGHDTDTILSVHSDAVRKYTPLTLDSLLVFLVASPSRTRRKRRPVPDPLPRTPKLHLPRPLPFLPRVLHCKHLSLPRRPHPNRSPTPTPTSRLLHVVGPVLSTWTISARNTHHSPRHPVPLPSHQVAEATPGRSDLVRRQDEKGGRKNNPISTVPMLDLVVRDLDHSVPPLPARSPRCQSSAGPLPRPRSGS